MSRYGRDGGGRDGGGRDGGRDDVACKVYVGDLPRDATDKEIERAFNYYGPIKKVWVARNPPGFAFVEFEDPRDADDAVRAMDGTTVCGVRARVEHSSGKIRPKPWVGGDRDRRGGGGGGGGGGRFSGGSGGGRGGGRGFDPNDRCYKCGERGHYAYDCRGGGPSRGGSSRRRSRSRSRSGDRRRSYSRSRSRGRYSHSRSRSPRKRSYSRSVSKGRRDSRSKSRGGDSPQRNGD